MRVLVCGGRDFTDFIKLTNVLEGILNEVWEEDDLIPITIIQGGAIGADFLAKVFATNTYGHNMYIFHKEFKADWKKYGNAAGPIRNQQMLDEGKPDLVVAFKGGNGTTDMINRAKKAGVPVKEIK